VKRPARRFARGIGRLLRLSGGKTASENREEEKNDRLPLETDLKKGESQQSVLGRREKGLNTTRGTSPEKMLKRGLERQSDEWAQWESRVKRKRSI